MNLLSLPFSQCNIYDIPSFIVECEKQLNESSRRQPCAMTEENVIIRVSEYFDEEVSDIFYEGLKYLPQHLYLRMQHLLSEGYPKGHRLTNSIVHRSREDVNNFISFGKKYYSSLRNIKFSLLPCLDEVATIYFCDEVEYERNAKPIAEEIYKEYSENLIKGSYCNMLTIVNELDKYMQLMSK